MLSGNAFNYEAVKQAWFDTGAQNVYYHQRDPCRICACSLEYN